MTDIKQQILETIDILTDKKINNLNKNIDKKINGLKFDKTVRGTINEILNDNYYNVNIFGEVYKLKYTKEELRKGSFVYVLIPSNNYKNMFILCPC